MEKKNIIDLIVLMPMSVIPSVIVQIIPQYDQLIPKIEKNVFEQLAKINATMLGFTLVGRNYYLVICDT